MTDKVHITINEGRIRGIKKTSSFSGTEYYSFLGVPYGQSTAGQARFKDPVKVKPWKTTLDATVEKQGCSQFSLLTRALAGSEDCLYNNIHTPQLPEEGEPLRAVIVNIHPGGFFYGSGDPSQFGSPEYIMQNDIVYVCINYRLHILGFLNLDLKECSGNQGFKDIILSLEWIKENIQAFGGDPNNVTVMGSSSGAAVINGLLISPRAKGLYHKAILMGMYSLNPALVADTPSQTVEFAFELAEMLGYDGSAENKKKLLSFLKKVSAEEVISLNEDSFLYKMKIPMFPSSPFLPAPDSGENSVFPSNIDELIPSTARVPIMVGFCEKEAAMAFINKYKPALAKHFYSTLTQNVWGWGHNLTDKELKLIKEQAEIFYLNGELTENASLTTRCEIQTDIALSDVYESLINVIAKDLPSSVYVYSFEFEGSIPTLKRKINAQMDEPLKGTAHSDDYCYWAFVKDYWGQVGYNLSPRTHEIITKFTKLICTFAKRGDPNYEGLEVQWKPSSVENPHYMSINDPLTLHNSKLNGQRMEFWENMKKKFTKSR